MGTDIHCFAELRTDGRWVHAGPFDSGNPAYADHRGPIPRSVYDDRNYEAFAILSGACSTIRTREAPAPIRPARGLPVDACAEIRGLFDLFGGDAHHASWLTLAELRDADWNATILGRGVVPDAVSRTLTRAATRMPLYEKAGSAGLLYGPANSGVGSEVKWTSSYRDAFGGVALDSLLDHLATFGAPDDVRIVFWFD